MSKHNQDLKFSLSAEEFNLIFDYQLASSVQLKKLQLIKIELFKKRPKFKRVNIILTLGDIDNLLVNISREANKNNNSVKEQYLLPSLFSKLGNKYNESIYS